MFLIFYCVNIITLHQFFVLFILFSILIILNFNKNKLNFNKNKLNLGKTKLNLNELKLKYIDKPLKKNKTYFLIKPSNNILKHNKISTILRKQKFFTKSKYSRTRQYCKNIVYLGLIVNSIFIFFSNSVFYGITLDFFKLIFINLFIFSYSILIIFWKLKLKKIFSNLYIYFFNK